MNVERPAALEQCKDHYDHVFQIDDGSRGGQGSIGLGETGHTAMGTKRYIRWPA